MRKPLYILILAVTMLLSSGVTASRSSTLPQGSKACIAACETANATCLASGRSFHECAGELRRCKKGCR
jgi:hypothetical protein